MMKTNKKNKEIIANMRKFTKELVKDPQKCLEFLIKTGYLNPDGTKKELDPNGYLGTTEIN